MAPPPPASPAQPNTAVQLTIIIGVFCLLLNIAFYFLAGVYFDDQRSTLGLMATSITDEHIKSVRFAFVVFSVSTSLAAIGALFATRWVGHGLSVLAGVAAVIASVYSAKAGAPGSLPVALAIIGVLFGVLVWRSVAHSRAAWSFLIAMCFTLAVILLFGAPKVRANVNVGLWTAMILPGMLTVAGIALVMLRREYRDKT